MSRVCYQRTLPVYFFMAGQRVFILKADAKLWTPQVSFHLIFHLNFISGLVAAGITYLEDVLCFALLVHGVVWL